MNSLILKLVLGGIVLSSFAGLYYLIGENAELAKDNENLIEAKKAQAKAIGALGLVVQDLNIKYTKATHDEFNKFNESDIRKIPMDDFIMSYNVGTVRVLKDYRHKTRRFIKGSTKTTSTTD